MSEVALQIGGRTYRVACAPGEEARVKRLGSTIDEKLAAMGNPTGPDTQNLLFAALLLADEALEGREAVANAAAASGEREGGAAAPAELEARIERAEAERRELESALAEREAEAIRMLGTIADLEAERDARAAAPAPPAGDLAGLAPALERFAEMLEECADKLERRAAAP